VNETFNVMKAVSGGKHQVVIKIVKQLDDLMIRDVSVPRLDTSISHDYEMDFAIPVPSSVLMEDGISLPS
jgi:hypothetical protein